MLNKHRSIILTPFIVITTVFLYNEYFIYYHILSKCDWPSKNSNAANVMLLADTHLLGSRNGHWFDKLRREWQQYRAYQTGNNLLKPNYIVILGDLTDEGKWCSDQEWNYYVKRTIDLFSVDNSSTKLFILVGNHDIGFHYSLHDHLIKRFNRSFTKQYVDYHQLETNNLNFIFINSMALENDDCKFCKETQLQLKQLNKTLNCLKNSNCDANNANQNQYKVNFDKPYTKPIIFTHFPLYRQSDSICPFDIDSEPIEQRYDFQSKYDCLSLEATHQASFKYKKIKYEK